MLYVYRNFCNFLATAKKDLIVFQNLGNNSNSLLIYDTPHSEPVQNVRLSGLDIIKLIGIVEKNGANFLIVSVSKSEQSGHPEKILLMVEMVNNRFVMTTEGIEMANDQYVTTQENQPLVTIRYCPRLDILKKMLADSSWFPCSQQIIWKN